MTQTLGQYRIGTTFNPSGKSDVDALKEKAAAFIDECERQHETLKQGDWDAPGGGNAERTFEASDCYQRAMREAESAAMWAVKAATKRERE